MKLKKEAKEKAKRERATYIAMLPPLSQNLRALPRRDKDYIDRPTTRGGLAPLIIATPTNLNSMYLVTTLIKKVKLTETLVIQALKKVSKIAITALIIIKLS